ncbi:hypothetical protein THMA_1753 [Thermotoga maritima MSB8]|uniref:Cell division protein ZapA n=1 Tax=Thermotoga maritima (strain ATCC 43589 / DSM 3109 / JCM 10099 / NBRC 100826 / MSB8) TaxID=243274 RepID=Q9X236_THEMA|nr:MULTISPECIES: hypothetical protein [Thermotoga]AAD36777.1 hypothetical protein TM_1711 [Thermotoga maritima MSB8]AGL50643.1 hypothetical protein Tmari_1719 [Thermotoga maritima MSB8]AHD18394.1 hypothetical protein THEMA_05685 [Thermotoga maritima MSB8]AIY86658.1 hypothetical protein T2812B_05595 [Thermotoga sp. 2812B]AKE27594.1 hypothetical protein THMC_1753 [Thermotoga maritima]
MKKKISVRLGKKVYNLVTDEDLEIVNQTIEKIEKDFKRYEEFIDEVGIDNILFVMLANTVLENVKMSERIRNLKKKLSQALREGDQEP